jgi:hypothetical protein
MTNAQLINQTSGVVEYYTPPEIIEAARATMGGIDLDPASSAKANEIVKAERFYTAKEDGLKKVWFGCVWLNHPFGRASNPLWIRRLISESKLASFRAACCVTYACTSEEWFRPLLNYPQCFLYGRTNYLLPDGSVLKGNTKGSVVTYIGRDLAAFAQHFRKLGAIKIAM